MLADCDLVIFDCDGVLVDSEPLAVRAFVEVLHEAGVGEARPEMVERCFGMKQADILKGIAEQTGREIPQSVPAALWPTTRRHFEAGLKPMPGIAAFLAALGARKRCVASSSHPERIATSLALTGLAGSFGADVFSSQQVARGKPAPDLFLLAATTMGVEPARCVVFEDSRFGVQGARAAGMTAYGFGGGGHIMAGHDATLSEAGAARVFTSWDEARAALD